jgi:hypothetical protein
MRAALPLLTLRFRVVAAAQGRGFGFSVFGVMGLCSAIGSIVLIDHP